MPLQPPGSGGLADQLKDLQQRVDELIRKTGGVRVFVQDDEPTTAKTGDLWTPLTASP